MMGLEPIAVASSDEKLAKCKELGAAHTLNYKSLTSDEFVSKVKQLGGADYILDPVFAQQFATNVQCINTDAVWVVYGFLGGFNLD